MLSYHPCDTVVTITIAPRRMVMRHPVLSFSRVMLYNSIDAARSSRGKIVPVVINLFVCLAGCWTAVVLIVVFDGCLPSL